MPLRRLAIPFAFGLFAAVIATSLALAGDIDFDTQVAPILASRCLECHSGSEPKENLTSAAPRPPYPVVKVV